MRRDLINSRHYHHHHHKQQLPLRTPTPSAILEAYVAEHDLDPDNTFFWICDFSIRQVGRRL